MKGSSKEKVENGKGNRFTKWISSHRRVFVFAIVFLLIHIIAAVVFWFFYYSKQQNTDIFWLIDFFDKFGVVTALGSLFISLMTWANTQDILRRRKTNIKSIPTNDSGVLAIQCKLGAGIEDNIRAFIFHQTPELDALKMSPDQEAKWSDRIEAGNHNLSLGRDNQFFLKKIDGIKGVMIQSCKKEIEIQAASKELEEILDEVTLIYKEMGVSDLHVFFMGSVVLPFIIGDYYANTFVLNIYEYTRNTSSNSKGMSYRIGAIISKGVQQEKKAE